MARTLIATCAVLCGLFLLAGLLLVGSFGLTADERERTRASEEAWAFPTGVGNGFSNHHTLPGYFALDLGRATLVSPGSRFGRSVRRALRRDCSGRRSRDSALH